MGPLGIHTRRLNRSKNLDSRSLAREEAKAIRSLSATRPLRLHVVGDARTESAVEVLASAGRAYTKRGGQPVWTYTHAWRAIRQGLWRGVSVLASVENLGDAILALLRGYAPALVVDRHPKDGKAWTETDLLPDHPALDTTLKIIPCPAQTRGKTCEECKLCFDANALYRRNAVIAFEAHGSGQRKVREAIR